MSSEAVTEAFYAALLDDDPEQLYDRAPCGYLTTTSGGMIVKANATFLDLTGFSREQLVGQRRFADLLNAGGRIYHETHFAPMLQMQGTVREVAFDLVRADGSRLPVLVNAVLETAPDGAPHLIRAAEPAGPRRVRVLPSGRRRRGGGRRLLRRLPDRCR